MEARTVIHRFHGINEFHKKKFGEKIYKLSIKAGFTCPNRDGTKARGGCTFCNNDGHKPLSYLPRQDIKTQIEKGLSYLTKRHRAQKFIAYFQDFSATYAPVEYLRELYFSVLEYKEFVGINIGTRSDCLQEPVLDVLSELHQKIYLLLDIGLQTSNNDTLKLINRAETTDDFIDAVTRVKKRHIDICTHVILGLPGETPSDYIDTAKFINHLPIDGIKIHNLHVIKNTRLADDYHARKFVPLSLEDYSLFAARFLEFLRPEIVIHRLTGEAPESLTIAPKWSVNKLNVLNTIKHKQIELNSWQGKQLGFSLSTLDSKIIRSKKNFFPIFHTHTLATNSDV